MYVHAECCLVKTLFEAAFFVHLEFLDTLEPFYIYVNTKHNRHLNNIYSDVDNPVYDLILAHASQYHTT